MSKDDVRLGDVVRINTERHGRVVAIVEDENSLSDGFFFREHGRGVMFEFDGWGKAYYPADHIDNDEDLFLVKRADADESARG